MLKETFSYLSPYISHYLNNAAEAAFSAAGAFLPIFILMCIHYKIRKSEYKTRRDILESIQKMTKSIIEIDEKTLGSIYQQLRATDYIDFREKMKGLNSLNDVKLINMVNESENRKFENIQKSLDLTTE